MGPLTPSQDTQQVTTIHPRWSSMMTCTASKTTLLYPPSHPHKTVHWHLRGRPHILYTNGKPIRRVPTSPHYTPQTQSSENKSKMPQHLMTRCSSYYPPLKMASLSQNTKYHLASKNTTNFENTYTTAMVLPSMRTESSFHHPYGHHA